MVSLAYRLLATSSVQWEANLMLVRREFFAGSTALTLASMLPGQAKSASTGGGLRLNAVIPNQSEPIPDSRFRNPSFLAERGYTADLVMDGGWLNSAVLLDAVDTQLFPIGSAARDWVQARADRLRAGMASVKAAGLAPFGQLEIIVLPRTARALFGDEVLDADGRYDLSKPKTVDLHRAMFRAIRDNFPDLAGVVVRTGENYLDEVPYHDGNTPLRLQASDAPLQEAAARHSQLINLLREEFCEAGNLNVLYRTWAFGGIHTEPSVYLAATDPIEPHPKLVMSIKHTKGDYQRNFPFNPTLGLGKHQQIVEIQCAREYEGKGAYPNYVAAGVIDGFEENRGQSRPRCLRDLNGNPLNAGMWTWARGGGWKGPYIKNEFWPALNANVLARWFADRDRAEADVFEEVVGEMLSLRGPDLARFRTLCLLSADGILRGRSSLIAPVAPFWIRDEFIGGVVPPEMAGDGVPTEQHWGILNQTFAEIVDRNVVNPMLSEKAEAVAIWGRIEALAGQIVSADRTQTEHLRVSSRYGRLLHEIISSGWTAALLTYAAERGAPLERDRIAAAVAQYDTAWTDYRALAAEPQCATLYQPYSFVFEGPDYHGQEGMGRTVDRARARLRRA
jgi:hypothetical protein